MSNSAKNSTKHDSFHDGSLKQLDTLETDLNRLSQAVKHLSNKSGGINSADLLKNSKSDEALVDHMLEELNKTESSREMSAILKDKDFDQNENNLNNLSGSVINGSLIFCENKSVENEKIIDEDNEEDLVGFADQSLLSSLLKDGDSHLDISLGSAGNISDLLKEGDSEEENYNEMEVQPFSARKFFTNSVNNSLNKREDIAPLSTHNVDSDDGELVGVFNLSDMMSRSEKSLFDKEREEQEEQNDKNVDNTNSDVKSIAESFKKAASNSLNQSRSSDEANPFLNKDSARSIASLDNKLDILQKVSSPDSNQSNISRPASAVKAPVALNFDGVKKVEDVENTNIHNVSSNTSHISIEKSNQTASTASLKPKVSPPVPKIDLSLVQSTADENDEIRNYNYMDGTKRRSRHEKIKNNKNPTTNLDEVEKAKQTEAPKQLVRKVSKENIAALLNESLLIGSDADEEQILLEAAQVISESKMSKSMSKTSSEKNENLDLASDLNKSENVLNEDLCISSAAQQSAEALNSSQPRLLSKMNHSVGYSSISSISNGQSLNSARELGPSASEHKLCAALSEGVAVVDNGNLTPNCTPREEDETDDSDIQDSHHTREEEDTQNSISNIPNIVVCKTDKANREEGSNKITFSNPARFDMFSEDEPEPFSARDPSPFRAGVFEKANSMSDEEDAFLRRPLGRLDLLAAAAAEEEEENLDDKNYDKEFFTSPDDGERKYSPHSKFANSPEKIGIEKTTLLKRNIQSVPAHMYESKLPKPNRTSVRKTATNSLPAVPSFSGNVSSPEKFPSKRNTSMIENRNGASSTIKEDIQNIAEDNNIIPSLTKKVTSESRETFSIPEHQTIDFYDSCDKTLNGGRSTMNTVLNDDMFEDQLEYYEKSIKPQSSLRPKNSSLISSRNGSGNVQRLEDNSEVRRQRAEMADILEMKIREEGDLENILCYKLQAQGECEELDDRRMRLQAEIDATERELRSLKIDAFAANARNFKLKMEQKSTKTEKIAEVENEKLATLAKPEKELASTTGSKLRAPGSMLKNRRSSAPLAKGNEAQVSQTKDLTIETEDLLEIPRQQEPHPATPEVEKRGELVNSLEAEVDYTENSTTENIHESPTSTTVDTHRDIIAVNGSVTNVKVVLAPLDQVVANHDANSFSHSRETAAMSPDMRTPENAIRTKTFVPNTPEKEKSANVNSSNNNAKSSLAPKGTLGKRKNNCQNARASSLTRAGINSATHNNKTVAACSRIEAVLENCNNCALEKSTNSSISNESSGLNHDHVVNNLRKTESIELVASSEIYATHATNTHNTHSNGLQEDNSEQGSNIAVISTKGLRPTVPKLNLSNVERQVGKPSISTPPDNGNGFTNENASIVAKTLSHSTNSPTSPEMASPSEFTSSTAETPIVPLANENWQSNHGFPKFRSLSPLIDEVKRRNKHGKAIPVPKSLFSGSQKNENDLRRCRSYTPPNHSNSGMSNYDHISSRHLNYRQNHLNYTPVLNNKKSVNNLHGNCGNLTNSTILSARAQPRGLPSSEFQRREHLGLIGAGHVPGSSTNYLKKHSRHNASCGTMTISDQLPRGKVARHSGNGRLIQNNSNYNSNSNFYSNSKILSNNVSSQKRIMRKAATADGTLASPHADSRGLLTNSSSPIRPVEKLEKSKSPNKTSKLEKSKSPNKHSGSKSNSMAVLSTMERHQLAMVRERGEHEYRQKNNSNSNSNCHNSTFARLLSHTESSIQKTKNSTCSATGSVTNINVMPKSENIFRNFENNHEDENNFEEMVFQSLQSRGVASSGGLSGEYVIPMDEMLNGEDFGRTTNEYLGSPNQQLHDIIEERSFIERSPTKEREYLAEHELEELEALEQELEALEKESQEKSVLSDKDRDELLYEEETGQEMAPIEKNLNEKIGTLSVPNSPNPNSKEMDESFEVPLETLRSYQVIKENKVFRNNVLDSITNNAPTTSTTQACRIERPISATAQRSSLRPVPRILDPPSKALNRIVNNVLESSVQNKSITFNTSNPIQQQQNFKFGSDGIDVSKLSGSTKVPITEQEIRDSLMHTCLSNGKLNASIHNLEKNTSQGSVMLTAREISTNNRPSVFDKSMISKASKNSKSQLSSDEHEDEMTSPEAKSLDDSALFQDVQSSKEDEDEDIASIHAIESPKKRINMSAAVVRSVPVTYHTAKDVRDYTNANANNMVDNSNFPQKFIAATQINPPEGHYDSVISHNLAHNKHMLSPKRANSMATASIDQGGAKKVIPSPRPFSMAPGRSLSPMNARINFGISLSPTHNTNNMVNGNSTSKPAYDFSRALSPTRGTAVSPSRNEKKSYAHILNSPLPPRARGQPLLQTPETARVQKKSKKSLNVQSSPNLALSARALRGEESLTDSSTSEKEQKTETISRPLEPIYEQRATRCQANRGQIIYIMGLTEIFYVIWYN